MTPTRVMFFCLGNICRSPLGEGLFLALLERRGLSHRFHVASSGTSAYHVGEAPDPGSCEVARRLSGIDLTTQRAQQLTSAHLRSHEHVVAMSRSNIEHARALPHSERAHILLLRDFEPDAALRGLDVPDPWGEGEEAFEQVHAIVSRCCEGLLEFILSQDSAPAT